jgi:dodecin
MNEHIINNMEVIGYSKKNIEDAVQKAVEKVAEGHKNVRWFEVTDLRGEVCDNLFCNWQVTLKVGYEMT